MRRFLAVSSSILLFSLSLASCGEKNCSFVSLSVLPPSVTADHNAPSPGNSAQFLAFGTVPSGCVTTAVSGGAPQSSLRNVVWTVSDNTNVIISNAQDATYGTAICLGPTAGPATVTAVLLASQNRGSALLGTSSLTCN